MKNLILLFVCCAFIAACGIKPGSVDGAEGYPRTYPDVSTDPKP